MRRSRHFNPRAPCGARLNHLPPFLSGFLISIHAPLAGRDLFLELGLVSRATFQSTRPLRGATQRLSTQKRYQTIFQSTRPLRGATLKDRLIDGMTYISIHAPLAGRDHLKTALCGLMASFQSTRPLRGATGGIMDLINDYAISIHAPLAGRDIKVIVYDSCVLNFNPRAPCGARPPRLTQTWLLNNFNPRAPCGARRWRPYH